MKAAMGSGLAVLSVVCAAQTNPSALDSKVIFERAQAATVMVLAGEGTGRLSSVATGVVISQDGVILTPYHAIKGATEVQVRLADGDVFDRVELLGFDERRDVAAIEISAGELPALKCGSASGLAQGDPVYAVTNEGGRSWSETEGVLSAIRSADEVPGSGTGFRLLQFTAAVAPGASGGALVDRTGALVGIIVGGKGAGVFAVPIESVLGLPDLGPRKLLGSGANLQMPTQAAGQVAPQAAVQAPQSSATVASASPKQSLREAKTIYLSSKSAFIIVDTVVHALTEQPEWEELGLTIVTDRRVADVFITFDHPIFTYRHTFVITDRRTTMVLGSGQVIAFDGSIASGGLAKQIVKIFSDARLAEPTGKK